MEWTMMRASRLFSINISNAAFSNRRLMSADTGARPTLAVFVSSHGFGHAYRSCAVLEHLCDLEPELQIELFRGFNGSLPLWVNTSSCRPTVTSA